MMHPKRFQLLGYLQLFIGMGALSGGLPMVLSPSDPSSGMSTQVLQGSPFDSFLIPGILLLTIYGAGNLVGSYFSLKFKKMAGHLGIILGFAMIVWIVVQMVLLGYTSWLQPLFLLLGFIELGLGLTLYNKTIPK